MAMTPGCSTLFPVGPAARLKVKGILAGNVAVFLEQISRSLRVGHGYVVKYFS
jgi:hypothetical protein